MRVGRDDDEQTVPLQQALGLQAAQPALVGGRQVLQQQAEHHGVQAAARQALHGAAQRPQLALHGLATEPERRCDLQLQEVAAVDRLKRERNAARFRVQELCESRGGRPGLSVLTSLTVSVDVKQY